MNVRLLGAAAVAALIAGPVSAQTTPNTGTTNMSAQGSMMNSAPPCTPAPAAMASGGMSGTGGASTSATVTASAGGVLMCTSGMGKIVVSNAPIPDSPDTRARTGGPESRGGKMTAPRPGPVRKTSG